MSSLQEKLGKAHRLTLGGIIAFMLLGMLPSLLEGFATPRWTIDLLYIVPIAIFLPFLKHDAPKRYAWLCFVILVFFCEGVLDAFAWPATEAFYGFGTIAVSCEIFIASMLATRWAGQLLARSAAPDA